MFRPSVPLMVLAVAAGPLAAQPRAARDSYRATIDTNMRQYTDPVVQADLKLTDEQRAALIHIPDDLLAKHKAAIEKEKAADKEAAEKSDAQRAELQKKLDALIEKHLTADQRKRLNQLAVQAAGVSAFRDEEVAKALALPADSLAKLTEIQRAGMERLQKAFPNLNAFPPTLDADGRRSRTEAMRKMAQESVNQFVATFTDAQKKAWKELVGEPSEAAVGDPVTGGRGLSLLLNPGSRSFWLTPLLSNDNALAELKVEKPARDALAAGMKEIQEAATAANSIGFGGRVGVNSVSRTIAQEASQAARRVLTEPQAKRLEQIRFQMSGTGAFSTVGFTTFETVTATGRGISPNRTALTNVLAKLTLTPAQVVKIDAALADASTKQRALGTPAYAIWFRADAAETEAEKTARLEYRQKSDAIERAALAVILATFDGGQQAAWKELAGEPIDVSKISTADTSFGRFRFGGFAGPGGRTASVVNLWAREATLRMNRGEYAAALAAYDDAIRLAPNEPLYKQSKARLLAACPSEWVRDGKQAVELMKRVVADTKEPTAAQIDVLAAALAESGQYDEAVKAQEKAIAALPADDGTGRPTRLKPQYEERLKLYQEKKPYRLSPRPAGPAGGD